MNIFIAKLGATGDVVRTSALLRRLEGDVTWVTSAKNVPFVDKLHSSIRVLPWENREAAKDRSYDLVISLEDTPDVAQLVASLKAGRIFGAHFDASGKLTYSQDSHEWFDLSLISVHGRAQADHLKYLNRRTYQDMVFRGLGYQFNSERYLLPTATPTNLKGDVAIAAETGAVWPMKHWAYYNELKQSLEAKGLRVNFLPQRATLLEHLGDVQNHRCLVGGDSLPMHLALGSGVRCVSIFNCTSPWEIFEYGILTKIVSPLLGEYFYKRTFEARATTAIPLDVVLDATLKALAAGGKT